MDAIKAIIRSDTTDSVKSRLLVTVVKEDGNLLEKTIVLLTTLSEERLLATFLTDYEYLSTYRRKTIVANSGSEWTDAELKYFMIDFVDTDDFSTMCNKSNLTEKASLFLRLNKDLTRRTMALGFTLESAINADTEFKKDVLFAVNAPSNESSVDDMVKTFLSEILSDRFLVKTRYDMQLKVSSHKKKATADVIVVLFPQLYIGIVVVEDKAHETSKSENQWDNAEAQTVAEAIAVMQQKNWPKGMQVFAIRVLETYMTIYKLPFDTGFLNDVEKGIRRDIPYVITRFIPETTITGQKPGWDLLDPSLREILVNAISDISVYIETTNDIVRNVENERK